MVLLILLLLRDASEQHQEDPIRFINWSSSRCVQSNDFRAPFRDWWCWPLTISRPYTYVRQRGFLLLPTTTSHYGTHIAPLNPPLSLLHTSHRLYGDETLITEIAFCRHPFRSFVRRWLLFHDEPKRRGWWYDSDLRILTTFPLELCTFVLVSTAAAAKKKHRVFPTFRWDMTIIRKHRNVL